MEHILLVVGKQSFGKNVVNGPSMKISVLASVKTEYLVPKWVEKGLVLADDL